MPHNPGPDRHTVAHLLAAAGFERVAAIHDEFADSVERSGDVVAACAHRREGASLRWRAALERWTAGVADPRFAPGAWLPMAPG